MFASVIQTAGLWFLVAVALEAIAVFVGQAGAARSPDEEAPPRKAGALLALVLSTVTPGLLLTHAFLTTHGGDPMLGIWAMGAPIAAVLGGALLGAILGAATRSAAPTMRKLALPLDLIAFAVTIFAALPSIQTLIAAAQNGGVIGVP